MKLTAAQTKAIEDTKRMINRVYAGCEFTVYTPANTDITRLVATYTIKNVLDEDMTQSKAWTIGRRGKVTEA